MVALTGSRAVSQKALDLMIVRSNILGFIENDEFWTFNANSPGSGLDCISSNSFDSCRAYEAAGPALRLVDNSSNVIFDAAVASAGLDRKGNPCTSYGTDPDCFIRPLVTWKPICPPAGQSCNQPLIQVDLDMQTSLTENRLIALMLPSAKISFYRSAGKCSPTSASLLDGGNSANWQSSGTTVNTNAGEPKIDVVNSSQTSFSAGSNFAYINTAANSCGNANFRYRLQIANSALADNQAQVCLYNSNTSQCDFLWTATGNAAGFTWRIEHRQSDGTMKVDKTGQQGASNKTFRFEISQQRVNFYYDEMLVWVFETAAYMPMSLRAFPPPYDITSSGGTTGMLQFFSTN